MRQTISLIAQIVRPDQIIVAKGTELDLDGFPVGPEVIELESAFPEIVQHAQRKARWLRLIEACENHVIDLRETTLEGIRLGSGRVLTRPEMERMELEGLLRTEKIGSSLLVVSHREPEESELSRAMDIAGCNRVHYSPPRAYENLICAFARANGQEIGSGMIRRIDWDANAILAVSTAVAPVPVRILRVGSLRVDPSGQELGEIRSWQV
jgi:polynucleotide 5'-kinase involved in rRNA processing